MPLFTDILGQPHIKKELMRAVAKNKISHAYIFSGEALSGKKFTATAFAQALLCENPRVTEEGAMSCGVCPSCKKAGAFSHPDLRIITHEKPLNISVQEIKEQLTDDCVLMPYSAGRKIYIVPDAELMNTSTQNKLLKTLEEPPSYVTIMLLVTSTEALLPTVRSRCVLFRMQPVENGILKNYLINERQLSAVNADFAVRFARGSAGRAIMFSEDELFAARSRRMTGLLTELHVMDIGRIDREVKEIFGTRCDDIKARDEFFRITQCFLRDLMICRSTKSTDNLILSDKAEYISNAAARVSFYNIEKINDEMQIARTRIARNVNALFAMEDFLARSSKLLS